MEGGLVLGRWLERWNREDRVVPEDSSARLQYKADEEKKGGK
jgi:hypothetical protein